MTEQILSTNPNDYQFTTGTDEGLTWIFVVYGIGEDYEGTDDHFDLSWTGIDYLQVADTESEWSTSKPESEVIEQLKSFGFHHNAGLLDADHDGEDDLPAEYQSTNPKDWLFVTHDDEDWCSITLVPKAYWDANGHLYDDHYDMDWSGIDFLMEPPATESTWFADKPEADVIAQMTAAGFEHRPNLFA